MFGAQFKKDLKVVTRRLAWVAYAILAVATLLYLGRRFWDNIPIAIAAVTVLSACFVFVATLLNTLLKKKLPTGSPASTSQTTSTASPQTEIDQLNDLIGQAKKKARQAQRAPGFNFIPVLLVYAIVILGSLWLANQYLKPKFLGQIGIGIIILAIILAKGLVIIRPAQFGVVTRFGMRLKGYLSEGGPYFLIPFIDAVEYLDYQVDTDPIEVSVTTGGKGTAAATAGKKIGQATVTIKGNLRKRPSPNVPNDNGKVLFIEINLKTITDGLEGKISSAIREVAGASSVDDFIENSEALKLFINCVLRLSETPHGTCGWKPEICLSKYVEHSQLITELLKLERGSTSAVERQFGIEVIEFDLTEINFSKQVMEAIEKRRLAESTADAAEELSTRRNNLIEAAKIKAGKDWDDPEVRKTALLEIGVMLGLREKPTATTIATSNATSVDVRGGDLLSAALAKYVTDKSGKKGD